MKSATKPILIEEQVKDKSLFCHESMSIYGISELIKHISVNITKYCDFIYNLAQSLINL